MARVIKDVTLEMSWRGLKGPIRRLAGPSPPHVNKGRYGPPNFTVWLSLEHFIEACGVSFLLHHCAWNGVLKLRKLRPYCFTCTVPQFTPVPAIQG